MKLSNPPTVIAATTYAIHSIPASLPKRLNAKLSAQLMSLDYTHANATRISSEVRRALKYPADNLRVGLRRNVETLQNKKEDTDKVRQESGVAVKYFANLVGRTGEIRRKVGAVDLEGPAPGVAGVYEA
jgi:mitofusin